MLDQIQIFLSNASSANPLLPALPCQHPLGYWVSLMGYLHSALSGFHQPEGLSFHLPFSHKTPSVLLTVFGRVAKSLTLTLYSSPLPNSNFTVSFLIYNLLMNPCSSQMLSLILDLTYLINLTFLYFTLPRH